MDSPASTEDSPTNTLLTNGAHHSHLDEKQDPSTNGTLQVVDEEEQAEDIEGGRKCCRRGPAVWCRKYFWEGQHVHESHQSHMDNLPADAPWYQRFILRHRRLVAFAIPALLTHFGWWSVMISRNLFVNFKDKFYMSLVMILGGLVAGMTSEGGGAVAFPVMTLAFHIEPSVARDFAIMIQVSGMSCATFAILFMKVKIEWRALLICSLGGAFGLLFGLYNVDPVLSASMKKMAFASVFAAFASVLGFINKDHKRQTYSKIQNLNWWRCGVLLCTGIMGGIFTSFTGNGLDICTFSILTLLFRISEKVATPTSVILMCANSCLCFFWRGLVVQEISNEAFEFLSVCYPVVTIMAPMGSVLGSHFHRLVLAAVVIILDLLALVGAYVIIRPLTPQLIGMSVSIIVVGFIMFGILSWVGQKLITKTDNEDKDDEEESIKEKQSPEEAN